MFVHEGYGLLQLVYFVCKDILQGLANVCSGNVVGDGGLQSAFYDFFCQLDFQLVESFYVAFAAEPGDCGNACAA